MPTTTLENIASQDELNNLFDIAQRSPDVMHHQLGNYTLGLDPTWNRNKVIIKKGYFSKEALEEADTRRLPNKEGQRVIDGFSYILYNNCTLYILNRSQEDFIEGYAVEINEEGLRLYRETFQRNEAESQKFLSRIIGRKYNSPNFEEFGIRRNITSTEANELSDILNRWAEHARDGWEMVRK